MSLQFHIVAGPDAGRTCTIHAGNDMVVGRGQHAPYRLNDPRVSRSHCQVLLEIKLRSFVLVGRAER
jgi:pSer/pThr/pTyr-binding forkhead associated (FHA) protein